MVGVNSFVYHLIEGNFPKLKNWAKVKCNSIQRIVEDSREDKAA